MFDHKHYVPILKWKRGEQKALELLKDEDHLYFTPLLEIVPPAYDYVNDRQSKSIDDHLIGIGEQISRSWNLDRPLFIDTHWLDPNELMKDGEHPLSYILRESNDWGVRAIPVISYDNRNLSLIAHEAHKEHNNGVCIRIEDDDFLDIEERLVELVRLLDISVKEIDIVIDYKYIKEDDVSRHLLSLISLFSNFPYINDWRTLILSSSSFPENLSGIPTKNIGYLPRAEWMLWDGVIQRKSKVKRLPTFSDYVIANPVYSEVDPRLMTMSANIRYTTKDNFTIIRGESIKKGGWEQTKELCKTLVSSPFYCGPYFSWGDSYIKACADGKESTGNAETWRRVGTNHHLTFVIKQIANYFES